MAYDPMRNVVQAVADEIARGRVVMCEKIKWSADGGKQLVSVGPYKRATDAPGTRLYAMITKLDEVHSFGAWHVAKEFVSFVGRDKARDAVRAARAKYAR